MAELERSLATQREEHERVEGRPNSWVRVAAVREGEPGAWVTGGFNAQANRVRIETGGVEVLVVHLDRIAIDWSRRVVLRIDTFTSELTRKRYPLLHMKRSPSGGWDHVER